MTGLEVDANGNGSLKKLKPSETIGKNIQCRELFVVELEQVVIYPLQKMENEAQRAFPRIFGHGAFG
ncbi:hypothetical protein Ahy_B08g089121 isoform B [Arachis hypogaea]|uniref:Uncharacterized protein n=1 Tax=Arachis hypogaea TaxID=3818 RepID=A0A444XWW3_ARAHY|nr:hypothetical protein Ahy_B08g089121 isoform B [Arachis hypogaea]